MLERLKCLIYRHGEVLVYLPKELKDQIKIWDWGKVEAVTPKLFAICICPTCGYFYGKVETSRDFVGERKGLLFTLAVLFLLIALNPLISGVDTYLYYSASGICLGLGDVYAAIYLVGRNR